MALRKRWVIRLLQCSVAGEWQGDGECTFCVCVCVCVVSGCDNAVLGAMRVIPVMWQDNVCSKGARGVK